MRSESSPWTPTSMWGEVVNRETDPKYKQTECPLLRSGGPWPWEYTLVTLGALWVWTHMHTTPLQLSKPWRLNQSWIHDPVRHSSKMDAEGSDLWPLPGEKNTSSMCLVSFPSPHFSPQTSSSTVGSTAAPNNDGGDPIHPGLGTRGKGALVAPRIHKTCTDTQAYKHTLFT